MKYSLFMLLLWGCEGSPSTPTSTSPPTSPDQPAAVTTTSHSQPDITSSTLSKNDITVRETTTVITSKSQSPPLATLPSPPHRRGQESEIRDLPELSNDQQTRYNALMIEGEAALYSGYYDKAYAAYSEAMTLDKQSASPALGALRSLVLDGQEDIRQGVIQRLRARIDGLAQRPGGKGPSYLLAARLHLALNEPGEALDMAQLAVDEMPQLGVARRLLGQALEAAELYERAAQAYQQSVELGLAAQAGTWERLASIYDELGQPEKAIEAANKAVQETGKDDNAQRRRLNLLALVYKHHDELTKAEEVAKRALELGNDPAVLHNLAAIYQAQNKPLLATKTYERALIEVENPTTMWRLAHLYQNQDRLDDAMQLFLAAETRLSRWDWPQSTQWLPAFDVGRMYCKARRFNQAIPWLEKAQRLAITAESLREIHSWLALARLRDPKQ